MRGISFIEVFIEVMIIMAIAGLILAIIFGSSDRIEKESNTPITEPNIVEVVVIEGCEYFKVQTDNIRYFTYAHKGNCTNVIHRKD